MSRHVKKCVKWKVSWLFLISWTWLTETTEWNYFPPAESAAESDDVTGLFWPDTSAWSCPHTSGHEFSSSSVFLFHCNHEHMSPSVKSVRKLRFVEEQNWVIVTTFFIFLLLKLLLLCSKVRICGRLKLPRSQIKK